VESVAGRTAHSAVCPVPAGAAGTAHPEADMRFGRALALSAGTNNTFFTTSIQRGCSRAPRGRTCALLSTSVCQGLSLPGYIRGSLQLRTGR
jgi:hypothetical protein